MYIIGGLGGCRGSSGVSLLHLVFKQEELEQRVQVLHDGFLHPFLQQVPFGLNLYVLVPCHGFHGGLQEAQAHQHRALRRRTVEKLRHTEDSRFNTDDRTEVVIGGFPKDWCPCDAIN